MKSDHVSSVLLEIRDSSSDSTRLEVQKFIRRERKGRLIAFTEQSFSPEYMYILYVTFDSLFCGLSL